MTDPITASAIATLAFQKFIESSAGELAKKFTGEAIAKMEQLHELIWSRLAGKNPSAEVALKQAKAGEQAGIDTVAAWLYVEMLDEAFAAQVQAITQEIRKGALDSSSETYIVQNVTGAQNETIGQATGGVVRLHNTIVIKDMSIKDMSSSIETESSSTIETKPESSSSIETESSSHINFGKAIIDAPHQMKIGVSEQVRVRISNVITNSFFRGLAHSQELEIENIRVSRFMAVSLRGDDFKIESFSPEQQIIEDSDFTQWEWKVVPLRSGNRKFWVCISIQIQYENEQACKTLPVLEKEIQVSINPVYSISTFVKQYWQWLIASALIPIVALLVKK